MMSDMLYINHKKKSPFIEKGASIIALNLSIIKDINVQYQLMFTPALYNTTEKLNTKTISYFKTQFTNWNKEIGYGDNIIIYKNETGNSSWVSGIVFAGFYIGVNNFADIYIREYRTFLDTLSKIGGLFSPLNILFELLIMFYSELETNSEIAKNVFAKIKNYEYKHANIDMKHKKQTNISLNISNENEQLNNENDEDNQSKFGFNTSKKNKEIRKKFKINKGEQYFCSFFNYCCYRCNFCKTHRTMKILNSCSNLVETYLSAENIIFNMILFENYYKNNYIKYNNNYYLNQIDSNIDGNIFENEKKDEQKNEKKDDNDKMINLISLNSDE